MRTSTRWRGALASTASAAVIIAVPLVGAQTAYAQPGCTAYPATVCLTVSPVTVTAGDTLTFSASGFEGGQTVTAVLASREIVLGRFTADATGTLTEKTVTIPSRTTAGYHTLKLIAHDPSRELTARIKVLRDEDDDSHHHGHSGGSHGHDASDSKDGSGEQGGHHHEPPALANTGNEKAMALVGAAGALVTMGAGTVVAVRRRRSS